MSIKTQILSKNIQVANHLGRCNLIVLPANLGRCNLIVQPANIFFYWKLAVVFLRRVKSPFSSGSYDI